MQSIEVRMTSKLEPAELNRLVALVNDAYAEGEKGICKPDLPRVTFEEMSQMLDKGGLILLRVNTILEGCIHIGPSPYDKNAGMFGMLAVTNEPELRGIGLGTLLVNEAEAWAKSQGYRFMDLELLKPLDFQHLHKNRLQVWYEKRGYAYQYLKLFKSEELLMIKNYEFKIYRKAL